MEVPRYYPDRTPEEGTPARAFGEASRNIQGYPRGVPSWLTKGSEYTTPNCRGRCGGCESAQIRVSYRCLTARPFFSVKAAVSCVHHLSYFAQQDSNEPEALGFHDARGQGASQFDISGGGVAQNKDRRCPTAHGWNAVTLCGMLKSGIGRGAGGNWGTG